MWTQLCQLLFPINTLGANWNKPPTIDSLTAKPPLTAQVSLPSSVQRLDDSAITEVRVDMADMKVESRPVTLVTNVGSCVAICIHDPINKCGGLAHIMLPSSKITQHSYLPSKYADTAVPALTSAIRRAEKSNCGLTAKIAGGANMFPKLNSSTLNIGMKNVEAVKEALANKGIKLVAEDVRGTYGRRVAFNIADGSVCVKNGNGEIKKI
ncbi:MAG: chemotaxis protein CheD [Candidatus Bathyarchaeota archaeon]|nr:chemotaxis protein CheD [Candidatus Bathyarchaeum sp.]